MADILSHCTVCPRKCGADRYRSVGYCGADCRVEVSKVMLHRWEEPCISGRNGSGAVFFSHCPLGCVFCQNRDISRRSSHGEVKTPAELAEIFTELQNRKAHNINLVSPTHYTPQLTEAVSIARRAGLTVPVVWNTGGYETAEAISSLRGTVDIFLTDFKYSSSDTAESCSAAANYPEYAVSSLRAMYDVVGDCETGEDGMLKKGIIVRQLILPGHRADSIEALRMIADTVPVDGIKLSLMAQFTPDFLPDDEKYSKLRRRITTFEYDSVMREALKLGFDGYSQNRTSGTKAYTPDFHAE